MNSIKVVLALAAFLLAACQPVAPAPTAPPQAVAMVTSTTEPDATVPAVLATDPTYGYNLDNPIRVGGLSLDEFNFSGLDRETVFFDNLRGPNGEPVSYERSGSLSSGDTILDVFLLTSSGFSDTRTLYIDAYNFQELFAPVGFTCAGRFTISAP